MTEAAHSLVFLKAKTSEVESILETLRADAAVRHVAITVGEHDLLAFLECESESELTKALSRIQLLPGVLGVEIHGVDKRWASDEPKSDAVQPWSRIDTAERELTFAELQQVEGIHEILATGGTNVFARISGKSVREVQDRLLRKVATTKGVSKTTTFFTRDEDEETR